MKLPPKPHVEYLDSGTHTDHQEWEAWGRACAEAMREECAKECEYYAVDQVGGLYAAAIRSIKVED